MKPFMQKPYFFIFGGALLLFGAAWFAREGNSEYLAQGRALTAQVVSAPSSGVTLSFSKTEFESVAARTSTLVTDLSEVYRKIQALPSTALPRIANLFQLTGTGPYAGYTNVSAGMVVPPATLREVVVSVKNTTGKPAEFFGIRGLSAPFAFKGGAYPGTGGTCGQSIPANGCTLVLHYTPSASHSGTNMGGVIRHTQGIYLDAIPEGADLGEPSNSLSLTGYFKGAKTANAEGELVAKIVVEPDNVLPNESAPFQIRVGLNDSSDSRTVFFGNVAITGVDAPFFIEKNECEKKAISGECRIFLRFKPVVAGTFRDAFSVSVDVGAASPKRFDLEARGITLLLPEAIDASKNVLVVYNADWHESIEAKNYYIANRPGFERVNTLGVHFEVAPKCAELPCLSEAIELPPYSKLQTQALNPIIAWLREHPDKDIRYIILMRGLPTRPDEATRIQFSQTYSIQHMIRAEAVRTFSKEVFVSSLDMGSLEATKAYSDKLKAVYALMPTKSLVLSARGTSFDGGTYYFSDAYAPNFENSSIPAYAFADALQAASPSARIVRKGYTDTALTSASNVSGIFHRGIYGYGWNKNYATDGTIRFDGTSGWYLAETAESFNGLWLTNGEQGSFITWFSKNAYGGTNYKNTPIAAVSHVIEPGARGYNGPFLFVCWDSGKPFAYCAWKSTNSPFALQVVGDPLVSR